MLTLGKEADLPVYYGDAGSHSVLHMVGAEHARCAIIGLSTPGANFRACWTLKKHFPHVRSYVRAFDTAQVRAVNE
jgi:voltage-gated potassium channel Kch